MIRNLIVQIFGIGAMLALFLTYQQTSRKRLLIGKMGADLFWVLHYLCLGAFGGLIPNFVGIFRETVFYQRDSKKWANTVLWPILFVLVNWGLGLHTFAAPINALPIAASTFVTISLWCRNPKLTKLISVPVSVAFLIYDGFVGSWIGMINECNAILSIVIYFIKEKIYFIKHKKGENEMSNTNTDPAGAIKFPRKEIKEYAAILSADVPDEMRAKGDAFAEEIRERFVSDFEKSEAFCKTHPGEKKDLMVHVPTFLFHKGYIYMTYYANTSEGKEDPLHQTARLAFCPADDPDDKTFLDIQTIGEPCMGKEIDMIYDTILAKKDDDTILIMWTASLSGNYHRLYRTFTISTRTLGEVCIHNFKVGDTVVPFSITDMKEALTANGIGYKEMYADIGIMQTFTTHVENGVLYYYTGAYSGEFTCIIKSTDLFTWEYVSQPDFPNESQWENAVHVIGDRCYYCVRQYSSSKYCFLTSYDLKTGKWEKPVLIEDCQSRCNFIVYRDQLYLIHAPIDREHLGIVRVDTENLANSNIVLQADMKGSCFYPYVQYGFDGELYLAYTVNREHIRLAGFTLSRYL